MAWDLDFAEDDGFVPMLFGEDSFGTDFETDFSKPPPCQPSFFQMSQSNRVTPPPECQGCSQSLVEENNELRQTALSLKEKLLQMSSLNERLKSQLEECRSNFRNVIFSGFNETRK